jgi:hypothetical protein
MTGYNLEDEYLIMNYSVVYECQPCNGLYFNV